MRDSGSSPRAAHRQRELTAQLKHLVEDEVLVRDGRRRINCRPRSTGHIYFTLKDDCTPRFARSCSARKRES